MPDGICATGARGFVDERDGCGEGVAMITDPRGIGWSRGLEPYLFPYVVCFIIFYDFLYSSFVKIRIYIT